MYTTSGVIESWWGRGVTFFVTFRHVTSRFGILNARRELGKVYKCSWIAEDMFDFRNIMGKRSDEL